MTVVLTVRTLIVLGWVMALLRHAGGEPAAMMLTVVLVLLWAVPLVRGRLVRATPGPEAGLRMPTG